MLLHYLQIGLGGALGAIIRVALGNLLPTTIRGLPISIVLINIIGCILMGALVQIFALQETASLNMRYFLVSGFLGGFTTFSAFAFEFALLYERHEYGLAFLYAVFSVCLSLLGFFIGLKTAKLLLW